MPVARGLLGGRAGDLLAFGGAIVGQGRRGAQHHAHHGQIGLDGVRRLAVRLRTAEPGPPGGDERAQGRRRLVGLGRKARVRLGEQHVGRVDLVALHVGERADQQQPGVVAQQTRGVEPFERRADLRVVARGGQHRAVLAQRVADQVLVVGERRVAKRARGVVGVGEPGERAPMQVGGAVGPPSPQVGVQVGAQQRMEAEPPLALAVAHHQRRPVLQVGQHVGGVAAFGQRGGQRRGDGVAHAHREQHLDHLVGQRGEDLADEVVGDRLPVAGEIGEERRRVRGLAQRDAGQAQRRGPARRLRVQQPVLRGGDADVGPRQHGRGLLGGEGERGRAQLAQLAREAKPPQAQRRVGAARQHQPQARRPVLEQGLQARDRVGVDQLLQVVEHHHERPRHGHERVDDGVEELGAAARHLGEAHGAQRVAVRDGRHRRERGEHARPEPPVGVVLAVQREPGDPAGAPGDPVGQQERLAVARGRRDEDDLAVAGVVKVVAQPPTRQVHRRELRDCRSNARDRRAGGAPTCAGAHDPDDAT